jgi:hypothetical protein
MALSSSEVTRVANVCSSWVVRLSGWSDWVAILSLSCFKAGSAKRSSRMSCLTWLPVVMFANVYGLILLRDLRRAHTQASGRRYLHIQD